MKVNICSIYFENIFQNKCCIYLLSEYRNGGNHLLLKEKTCLTLRTFNLVGRKKEKRFRRIKCNLSFTEKEHSLQLLYLVQILAVILAASTGKSYQTSELIRVVAGYLISRKARARRHFTCKHRPNWLQG